MLDKRKFAIWLGSVAAAIVMLALLRAWFVSSHNEAVPHETPGAEPSIRQDQRDTRRGMVTQVVDGDTITCLIEGRTPRIRLFGIDAPEARQPFGPEAAEYVRRQTLGEQVDVEFIEMDRYGRWVAKVWLEDRTFLNEKIVRAGFAWWYRKYAPKDQGLSDAEMAARAGRVGLWRRPNPVPPWEFRNFR